EGLLKTGFRLRRRRLWLPQEQDAPEATDFRFPVAFLVLLYQSIGFGQRLEAVCRMAEVVTDVRQHGAQVWDVQRRPVGPPGGEPLADLGHPLRPLALHGQRPPTQARSPGHMEWKALRGRERNGGRCVLV